MPINLNSERIPPYSDLWLIAVRPSSSGLALQAVERELYTRVFSLLECVHRLRCVCLRAFGIMLHAVCVVHLKKLYHLVRHIN